MPISVRASVLGRLLASSGGRAVNEGGVGAAGARTAPDIHENQEALSTSAECGDGVRYHSDSDESDSDDE